MFTTKLTSLGGLKSSRQSQPILKLSLNYLDLNLDLRKDLIPKMPKPSHNWQEIIDSFKNNVSRVEI